MTDEDQTTSIGLFNTADSFWLAGERLSSLKLKTTHPRAPVDFLHLHALELYLKAHLREQGVPLEQLKSRPLGHNVDALAKECARRGLTVDKSDLTVLQFIAETDAMMVSRYIRTGARRAITLEALGDICSRLRALVADEMKKAGYPVRSPDVLRGS